MANEAGNAPRRAMQRFLRYLATGESRRVARTEEPAEASFLRDAEAVRRFDRRIVEAALSRGLVGQSDGCFRLEEPGRFWLKRSLSETEGDSFARQHADPVEASAEVDGMRQTVTVNAAESPLAALRRLKQKDGAPFLDDRIFQAGERLRVDFTRGQLQPRISANWEASVSSKSGRAGGGIGDLSDAALGARMRVERALAAVGPELSGVLVDICCFLKGLETVERERRWPARSAKLMLRTALCMLARHYDPPASGGGRRSHRWAAGEDSISRRGRQPPLP